jgi:hypothetical protein
MFVPLTKSFANVLALILYLSILLHLYSLKNWYIEGVGGGVQLGPLGTAATNRPIVPAQGDYDGEIGGMIGRGN